MTVIVGFVDKSNGTVWMGCDSLGSNGFTQDLYENKKVFRNKTLPQALIGVCGSYRAMDLLKYGELAEPIEKYEKPVINHEYMVTKFIPKTMDIFTKGEESKSDEGKKAKAPDSCNYLFATQGKLFEVQTDYSVLETSRGFSAVGSGEFHANGCLTVLAEDDELKPFEKIEKALIAAETNIVSVKRPFYIFNTENEEVITIS